MNDVLKLARRAWIRNLFLDVLEVRQSVFLLLALVLLLAVLGIEIDR